MGYPFKCSNTLHWKSVEYDICRRCFEREHYEPFRCLGCKTEFVCKFVDSIPTIWEKNGERVYPEKTEAEIHCRKYIQRSCIMSGNVTHRRFEGSFKSFLRGDVD